MADRPIIFSGPMVRALLAGRKTQTRRLLKPAPELFPVDDAGTLCDVGCMQVEGEAVHRIWLGSDRTGVLTTHEVRFGIGDRLYVREAWSHTGQGVWDIATARMVGRGGVIYAADGARPGAKYWPSIHMPREFSRLTLTVTEVRVQRLNDISCEDAKAEGISSDGKRHCPDYGIPGCAGFESGFGTSYAAFRTLWNSLHGADGTRWENNPWIYALTFSVEQRNIDA